MNHRDYLGYAEISYWRDNKDGHLIACDKADAQRATLEGLGGYPNFNFNIPSQQRTLDDHVLLLKYAFDRGKSERSKEIRALL